MTKPIAQSYHPQSPNFYTGSGEVHVTKANLPHWNKKNIACFVTFRLCDSLPKEKLVKLEEEREAWLKAKVDAQQRRSGVPPLQNEQRRSGVPPLLKLLNPEEIREYYSLFSEKIQNWLDQGIGSCYLRNDKCAKAVEDALWYFAGERYDLYAYVIMDNHVHILCMPRGENKISNIVESIKKFTAHRINDILNRNGKVWQKESFDTLVRNERHFISIINYIRKNDVGRAWAYNMM